MPLVCRRPDSTGVRLKRRATRLDGGTAQLRDSENAALSKTILRRFVVNSLLKKTEIVKMGAAAGLSSSEFPVNAALLGKVSSGTRLFQKAVRGADRLHGFAAHAGGGNSAPGREAFRWALRRGMQGHRHYVAACLIQPPD